MPKRSIGRCSIVDYGGLFRLVVDRPGTADQVAKRFGMRAKAVRRLLRQMADLGLIVVSAWRWTRHRRVSTWQPVYSFEGPPAPRPAMRRVRLAPPGRDMRCFVVLLQALMLDAMTPEEAAAMAGLHAPCVVAMLREFSESLHVIYVYRWMRSIRPGGPPVPLYVFGIDMKSRPRPKPQALRAIRARVTEQRRQRLLNIRMLFITAGRQYPPDLTALRSKGAPTP